MLETMNPIVIIVMLLQIPICIMMHITLERKNKYKDCIKQTVEKLRDVAQNFETEEEKAVACDIFAELRKHMPEKERIAITEQFGREK